MLVMNKTSCPIDHDKYWWTSKYLNLRKFEMICEGLCEVIYMPDWVCWKWIINQINEICVSFRVDKFKVFHPKNFLLRKMFWTVNESTARNRCIAERKNLFVTRDINHLWYAPLLMMWTTPRGVDQLLMVRPLWMYVTADDVDHASWCRSLWVHITADGVDHFECTPLPMVRITPRGVDHFECTPLLMVWTTPRDVGHFGSFCPFADVFCFFSADFDGFGPIVRHLASWLDGGKPSIMPKTTYPRVIIVTESQTTGVTDEDEAKIRFLSILKDETTKDFSTRFSALDVLCIFPSGTISNAARFRPLKESLMKASDHVRTSRATSRTLFSARHFAAFVRLACDHFATTSKEPFDFVTTSRSKDPVSPDLDKHLSNIKSPHELTEFAGPIIASSSSFLLDSYPPDMHGKPKFRIGTRIYV